MHLWVNKLHQSIVSRRDSSNRSLYCKVIPKQNVFYKCHWFSGSHYGENVNRINIKLYWQLFVEQVFNPFRIFQAFSVILWSLGDYYLLCRLQCIFYCCVSCHFSFVDM